MPSYIKSYNEFTITAQDWTTPEGQAVPKDQMWEHIKLSFPVYSGTLHSEQHELYTADIIAEFSRNNNREDNDEVSIANKHKELGAWFYVEDLEHDEDLKKVTMTWVAYYKDQDVIDDMNDFRRTLESGWKNVNEDLEAQARSSVDFHRPYML